MGNEGAKPEFIWFDEAKWIDPPGWERSVENPDVQARFQKHLASTAFQPWVDLDEIERECLGQPLNWQRFYLNRISDEAVEDRRGKRDPRRGTGGRVVQHADEERVGEGDHQPASGHGRQGGNRRRGFFTY